MQGGESRRERSEFFRIRVAEREYAARLRSVARRIAEIIRGFIHPDEDVTPEVARQITAELDRYSETIVPWAQAVGRRMLADVERRDQRAWRQLANRMGRILWREINSAPTGRVMQEAIRRQVGLITSLPREAAVRVHNLAIRGLATGQRAGEIRYPERAPAGLARDILETGHVTVSRANTIARTETSRAAGELTAARAQFVGSTHFVWRAVMDADTRDLHRKLNAQVFAWNDPPIAGSNGERALPGGIYNCFPGSTEVALTNGCHWLWRYWYEGRLVVIETEFGRTEFTPNHPVLCGRGWIAADDLQAGDHVIQNRRDYVLALEDDEHEGKTTFEEVFAALDALIGRCGMSGLLFDFHGDRPDHDVDTIRADALLPGYDKAPLFEFVRNLKLSGTDRGMRESGSRSRLHVSKAHLTGGLDEFPAISGWYGLHTPHVGLGAGTSLDTMTFENAGDRPSVAAVAERQRKLAFTREVGVNDFLLRKIAATSHRAARASNHDTASAEALAQKIRVDANIFAGGNQCGAGLYKPLCVVDKSVRSFSGHVFTMQAANGWFSVSPARIITKNCRCWAEPILPEKIV